jgi:prepilin-type processing-associated H-X9-DG protein
MAMDGIFMDAQKPEKRGRIAARHRGEYGKRGRTNVVFYDGHAEEYQWAQDYTTDPLWTATELHTTSNLLFRLDEQVY